MANLTSTRRTFLLTSIATVATAPALAAENIQPAEPEKAESFLHRWDEAWARHDGIALAALHTEDAVTVNRFGTVVQGRPALEKALGFLHGPGGPFHNSDAPPLELLIQRTIAAGVVVVQAKWQNPVMKPDGKIDPAAINDMIVTFVLVPGPLGWLASEVNLVNVEKMDLPFSNPGQKPA
jgi:acyl-CoA reductase-like NAD-dependent aldehyde dehydrogenase